jgi:hypothetical protein
MQQKHGTGRKVKPNGNHPREEKAGESIHVGRRRTNQVYILKGDSFMNLLYTQVGNFFLKTNVLRRPE